MSSFTDYLEDAVIQFFFRNDADTYTPPATVYVGLFTAAPSDVGGGTEVVGNGYARETVAFTDPAGVGVTANTGNVSFTASGGSWGSVTHFALFDAITTGNMMAWAPLTAAKTVDDGDTLTFSTGNIDLTVT